MKIKDVKVGDKVRVKQRVEAWGSRYALPLREYWLEPDRVGTVGAVKVPYVRKSYPHGDYYVCVDWLCPVTGRIERTGVDYSNLVLVEQGD